MPEALRDISDSFPCYTGMPSGGYHLFFWYDGPELKLRELAPAIEVKEWQITALGSKKENGVYALCGEFPEALLLYSVILECIEKAKRKNRTTAGRQHTPDR
jgi:hypothetical protein